MFLNTVQGDGISLGIEGRYQAFTGSAILRGPHEWLAMLLGIAANDLSKHIPCL
jgi:hypothetical protein